MKISNELKIGLTIVTAVLVGFIGFRIMKDVPLLRQGSVYYVNYERVDGLSVGTPVTLRGIKIGSVQRLTLLPSDSVQVAININMLDGLPVGSVAYIRSVDILGTKGIEITRGAGSTNIPHLGSIEGIFDEGFMGQLATRGGNIADNVSTSTEKINVLLSEVQQILQDGGSENIGRTLQSVNSATHQIDELIRESSGELKSSIESLRASLENIESLTADEEGNIKNTLANLEKASTELDELARNLNSVSSELASIMKKINDGDGTLGLMVNDPNLYHNLDTLAQNLNTFLEQMNENPRHYLRHLRLIRIF